MADGTEFFLKSYDSYNVLLGDELRGERATLGKSLLDVQRDLKIKAVYIAAIENCDIEAFPNKGYIAGYVRSYARYLKLDSEEVFERFCVEAKFSPSLNSDKLFNNREKHSDTKKQLTDNISWKPTELGLKDSSNNLNVFSLLFKFSPLVVLLLVLTGLSYGTISIIKDIQKLDVVAFEDSPLNDFQENDIATQLSPYSELSFDSSKYSEIDSLVNLYSSQELSSPLIQPRDGAISLLEPQKLSALNFYNKKENNIKNDKLFEENLTVLKEEPVLHRKSQFPKTEIYAVTPAWIRLTNQEGTIILEKTLKTGERYVINKDLFSGTLRSGNAKNVYFLINGEALGPLSTQSTVAKEISLNPEVIKIKYFSAKNITNMLIESDVDNELIDTALISE